MFFELIGVIISLYIYWQYFVSKRQKHDLPPEISQKIPILGHAHLFMGDSQKPWKTIQMISRETLENGGVTLMSMGPLKSYLITDPEDMLTASNACMMKNYYYGFAVPWLGEAFLTGNVQMWRKYRKMVTPALTQHVLNGFIDVFNYQGRRIVNKWREKTEPFIHSRDVSLNNLESICQNLLGIKVDDETALNEDYENALDEILQILTLRFKNFWYHLDAIYNLSSTKRREKKAVEVLHNMSEMALRKRKSKKVEKDSGNENYTDKSRSFFDVVLELFDGKDMYTDKDYRETVDNLIFAGHDTISSVMVISLVVLGSYQDIQEKVYEELQSVFDGSDRDLEKDDYPKLQYLEAFIKETLRMYPIVPAIARRVDKDVRLKNYTMEAGSNCLILFYGSHFDSSWGPDADKFKPERWLSPDTLPSNLNAFGAFSLGRRACIGKNYAMMSLKTSLSHLLREYRIKSDISKMVLKVDVMLKPESGHEICLERRIKLKIL